MEKMQKNLNKDLKDIRFSQKDFNFFKENNKTIMGHIRQLNELLQEILSTFTLTEDQQKIAATSTNILQTAIRTPSKK